MNSSKDHILEFLSQGIRFDGRRLLDYRQITVETGISKTAEGSARVKIGDTEVLAGVKLLVEAPFPDVPDQGSIMVNAEFLPLSNPEFESGPPGAESIELSRVVDRGIRESKALDLKELCIKKGEKVWVVSVDICTMNDAGNLLDASALAALAALKDTVFPKYENEEVDYKTKTTKRLPLEKEPIAVTVYKIGGFFIVDPLTEEQCKEDAKLTITTTADGKICALQKGGEVPLTVEDISQMVDIALDKAEEMRKYI